MMASIDELIANGAKTIPECGRPCNIPKAYYEGREQAYKQKMRDVFSDENGDHGGRTVHFIKATGLADCDR